MLAAAKLSRRHAESGAKSTGKGLVVLITGVQRDFNYGGGCLLEPLGGPFQPETPDVTGQRFAHHPRENVVEMMPGQTGQTGQVLQGQRFIQMLLNIDQNAEKGLLVKAQRSRFGLPVHVEGYTTRGCRPLDSFCGFLAGADLKAALCAALQDAKR